MLSVLCVTAIVVLVSNDASALPIDALDLSIEGQIERPDLQESNARFQSSSGGGPTVTQGESASKIDCTKHARNKTFYAELLRSSFEEWKARNPDVRSGKIYDPAPCIEQFDNYMNCLHGSGVSVDTKVGIDNIYVPNEADKGSLLVSGGDSSSPCMKWAEVCIGEDIDPGMSEEDHSGDIVLWSQCPEEAVQFTDSRTPSPMTIGDTVISMAVMKHMAFSSFDWDVKSWVEACLQEEGSSPDDAIKKCTSTCGFPSKATIRVWEGLSAYLASRVTNLEFEKPETNPKVYLLLKGFSSTNVFSRIEAPTIFAGLYSANYSSAKNVIIENRGFTRILHSSSSTTHVFDFLKATHEQHVKRIEVMLHNTFELSPADDKKFQSSKQQDQNLTKCAYVKRFLRELSANIAGESVYDEDKDHGFCVRCWGKCEDDFNKTNCERPDPEGDCAATRLSTAVSERLNSKCEPVGVEVCSQFINDALPSATECCERKECPDLDFDKVGESPGNGWVKDDSKCKGQCPGFCYTKAEQLASG